MYYLDLLLVWCYYLYNEVVRIVYCYHYHCSVRGTRAMFTSLANS